MKYALKISLLTTILLSFTAESFGSNEPNTAKDNINAVNNETKKTEESVYQKLLRWNDNLRPEWSKKLTNTIMQKFSSKTEKDPQKLEHKVPLDKIDVTDANINKQPSENKLSFKEKTTKFFKALKEWNDSMRPKWAVALIDKYTKKDTKLAEQNNNIDKNKLASTDNISPPTIQTEETNILNKNINIELPVMERKNNQDIETSQNKENANIPSNLAEKTNSDDAKPVVNGIESAKTIPNTSGDKIELSNSIPSGAAAKETKSQDDLKYADAKIAATQEIKQANPELTENSEKIASSSPALPEQNQTNMAASTSSSILNESSKVESNYANNNTQNPNKNLIIVDLKKIQPAKILSPEELEKQELAQKELEKFVDDEIAMLTLPRDDDIVLGKPSISAKLTYANDTEYISYFWDSYRKNKGLESSKKMRLIISELSKLDKEAPIDHIEGYTDHYISKSDIDGIRTLINHGDIDFVRYVSEDFDPVLLAIQNEQYNALYYLLMRGAPSSRITQDGITLLDIAKEESSEEVIWLLKKVSSKN